MKFSRRHFLKFTAAGVAASVVGPIGLDLTPEQAASLAARRQSGTLRIAWNPTFTLDPLSASADSEISFLNAVYDYLIDTDAQSALVPRLASEWAISDDGLAYTLKIREGVKFHDGSDLTVDDVIWTFNRLKTPETPTGNLYANIESIEAGENNSVVFKLTNTNPDFLYDLSDNHAVILKAEAPDIGVEFNGTGPFKLAEFLAADRAVFSANTDYWGGAPGVETLEFIYFDDNQAAVDALRGGIVDVAVRMDNATFLALADETGLSSVSLPTNGHDLVRLRSDREPGNNEKVRQAFKLATDRDEIFNRVQLGLGAVGRDSPIGPLFGDYYSEDTPLPARDPEAAKALLAEAGYPDGLDMTLYIPNTGDRPTLGEVLQAQWEEAGIRIQIELQDEATYYGENGWLEVDLGITPWGSRPRPQFYLETSLKTGAVWNESHFSDEELDALIVTAGTTLDEQERINTYKEIQRILIERGPIIVPYFFASLGISAESVQSFNMHPFPGRTNFNTVTIG